MNGWIHMFASHVKHNLNAGGLVEVLLESLIVLAVAPAVCLLWRRAAAATRHLIWFTAVASLPMLLCMAVQPHAWPKALWSVSKEMNSGNQVFLTLTLMPAANRGDAVRTDPPGSSTAVRFL